MKIGHHQPVLTMALMVIQQTVAARVVQQLLLMVATEMGYQHSLMASVGVIGSAMTRMEAEMVQQLLLLVATEMGYQLVLMASVGVNEVVTVVAIKRVVVALNSAILQQQQGSEAPGCGWQS